MIVWLKDVVNPNNVALLISFGSADLLINNFKNGINIAKGTIKTISGNPNIRIGNADVKNGAGATLIGAVILKGDYTTISLNSPFYGMQSVKMPVLTTTGKNLANTTIASGLMYYDSGRVYQNDLYYVTDFIKIPSNAVYSFNMGQDQRYCLFDSNKKYITGLNAKTFNSGDASFVRFSGRSSEVMMIEGSTPPTSYEPYKSNILTVNEDVTLRSNGDICDELILLNGQLTQRIGEDGVVLSQEVVKTVVLSCLDENNNPTKFKPYEGVMYAVTSSETLPPLLDMEVPVEAINQNLAGFIK